MIRSLRRKFILINLLLVGLVLAVVFGVLVGSNAQRLGEQSRVSLRMALEWADGGSPPRFEIASPPDGAGNRTAPAGKTRPSISPWFPFSW